MPKREGFSIIQIKLSLKLLEPIIMRYPKITLFVFLTAFLLAACSPAKTPVKYSMAQATSTGCATPVSGTIAPCKVNGAANPTPISTQTVSSQPDLTKTDAQGSVTIQIKPINLVNSGDTLVFDVSMNTHSVDLSMDLARLAVLSTNTGETIQAIQWDAPKGGHHVEGKLSFPVILDGKNFLAGANSITITISNVDAPARIFTWKLTG
jgi:hypothetical protein